MNERVQPEKVEADIEAVLGLDRPRSTAFKKWSLPLVVGAMAAAALALFILRVGGSGDPLRYVTEPATRGDLTVTVTATGTVQPTNEVEISSELSGIIRKVLVDYDSAVEVGQVLAELDTDKLTSTVDSSTAKLASAKAKVSEAEASVFEAKLEYARKQRLVAKQVSSDQQLESAEAAYRRALAALKSAKAEVGASAADLALNETNLRKAFIRSPIAGVVLRRNVEPGQTVASSLQAPVLFTIAEDLTKMEVQVDVDEADVGKVKVDQKSIFTVDAYPDRQFSAEIRELRFGSEVVQGLVTYKALLTTDNSELLLRPDMTATAEIVVDQVSGAVTVPNAALRFSLPNGAESGDRRNFLQKLLPGPPKLRPPSTSPAPSGPDRKIWILSGGAPKEVSVKLGPSDGKRTQILQGEIEVDQAVIVDTALDE